MKTIFLAIIGIVTVGVALTIGTMQYQTEYNQNCHDDNGKVTGFLNCTLIHEDFALPNPFTVGIPFDQTFQYEDLELYFYDIEDSRCPLDVTCVWEGEVTVKIHVRNQTHKTAGSFTPNYTLSYITPYNVTLVDVQPHPISTEKPDYIATLEITKLDDEKNTEPMKNAILDKEGGHYDYLPINNNPNMMAMEKIELLEDNSINVQFGQNNYEWSDEVVDEYEYGLDD